MAGCSLVLRLPAPGGNEEVERFVRNGVGIREYALQKLIGSILT
jgi:hypothetical protein